MTIQQRSIARWIIIVTALLAILELAVSIMLWTSPQSVVEQVDLKARGAEYLVHMWSTRQFALGCILAFAAIKRSGPMLTIAYLFLLVMFAGDIAIGVIHQENPLVISAAVMCLVSAAMLYFINRRK